MISLADDADCGMSLERLTKNTGGMDGEGADDELAVGYPVDIEVPALIEIAPDAVNAVAVVRWISGNRPDD